MNIGTYGISTPRAVPAASLFAEHSFQKDVNNILSETKCFNIKPV